MRTCLLKHGHCFCLPPIGPRSCDVTEVDVAFLMDSSGSIKDFYQIEKNFVKLMAKSFGIPESKSRVAIQLYSNKDKQSVEVNFDQTFNSTREFERAVDNLPFFGGETRIDKALELAHGKVFPLAKKGVPQIAVVLTDGEQTDEQGAKDLKDASEPLRSAGVRILAVGIGKVNYKELRLMTENDEDAIKIDNFNQLKLKMSSIANQLCKLAGKYPAIFCRKNKLWVSFHYSTVKTS